MTKITVIFLESKNNLHRLPTYEKVSRVERGIRGIDIPFNTPVKDQARV